MILRRCDLGMPYLTAHFRTQVAVRLHSFRFLSNSLVYSFGLVSSGSPLRSRAGFQILLRPDPKADETEALESQLNALGLSSVSSTSGQYDLIYCPKCKGGPSILRTLSIHISRDRSFALWRCFHLECGWADKICLEAMDSDPINRIHSRALVESLEPLGDELLSYFAERKISEGTLQRNNVMQVAAHKGTIAFTYKRNGLFVGCKYRTVDEKRFWQARNTEKILYGLDDIVGADAIIIVEGEIDKLSLEEAGYCNCVSVPAGAPQTVSSKELPPIDQDTGFQYLWNSKDYLEKASRIFLATDSDPPGQALAEELVRRLGKHRCFLVKWPKKDDASRFKDANEVLQKLGAEAVREAIEGARLYE